MPAEPNPYDDAELFDSIDLAGLVSPGEVTLSGHDSVVGWDIKSGAGQKGASMTKKSEEPREFTASIFMATDADFAAWPAFRDLINSSVSGAIPKALDIYHPDLEVNGFKSVVKGSIGGVVHDGKGGRTIAVKFQQYAPPVTSGGSPSGSKAKGPDPNAAANAELEALTKKYEATPWG